MKNSFAKAFNKPPGQAADPITPTTTAEHMPDIAMDKKKSLDHQHAAELAAMYVPGSPEEKRLLHKLDFRLIPCCWILSLLGYLDRSNIGNAKTGGMEDDLNLTDNQYSIIVLIFFVSYVLVEVPSNMLLTRVNPAYYLSGLCVVWGVVAVCMAATASWYQVAICRFFLGAVEAGFAPGCAYYLSSWYRNFELARRYAVYYTATATAGALSGLLAGVITEHLNGTRGIPGWRWLFIIEGCMSCFVGCFIWYIMPDYPSKTKFLSQDERILACQRLAMDGIGLAQGAHEKVPRAKAFMMTVKDWRVWAQTLLFVLVTGSQTMQYFIPTLIESFGWEGYYGQYMTIPGYAFGIVCILTFCWLADYYKNKWVFISIFGGIGTVFFIIVTASTDDMIRFICAIFAFGVIWGCSPLAKTWAVETISFPAEKRAISIAWINAIGNSSSIYGSFLWPDRDAPRYTPGFAVTTTWMGMLATGAAIFSYLFAKYPLQAPNADDVVASELRAQRERHRGKAGDA